MIKRIACFVCFLGLCAWCGCDDSSDSQETSGGNHEKTSKCQCENEACENCGTVTTSCSDDTHVKSDISIDGYNGSTHVIKLNSSMKSCESGRCVTVNDHEARCEESGGDE